MVVFGQNMLYWGKFVVLWQNLVVLGQIFCIRAKWLYSYKTVLLGQSDCIHACIHLRKICFLRANRLYSGNFDVFGQKGCFREKWLYS